jgi:uncharacterized protein YciI
MFILLLTYIKPIADVDAVLEPHRAFLDKYFEQGKFVCAGRQRPRTGGVILCNAGTREEVERIAAEDPFSVAGVAAYQVIEFQPTKWAEGFERFVG